MTQDHEVWTDDLDGLLLAVLDQPPPREEVRARGAVSLAALATQERNRAAAARRDWPAWLRRPAWRVRIAAGITVVAVAGGLALAVADTGQARPGPGFSQVTLAAFTVTRHHGVVKVTLRQLEAGWSASDRAALQRRLRADGVPAVVGFHGSIVVEPDHAPTPIPHALKCYPSPLLNRIFTTFHQHGGHGTRWPHGVAYEIHPARIPKGDRIVIPIQGATNNRHGHSVSAMIGGLLIKPGGRCLI